MKLAFYKAQPHGRVYQKVIAWWTGRGPYCHTEIVLDDGTPTPAELAYMNIVEHDQGGTLCFSSAENDGGTRFKILDFNPQQWDLVSVPLDFHRALKWCIGKQHIKYDFWGLRGFVFGRNDSDPNDLWCSECALECCQDQMYLAGLATNISPNALARAVDLLK